MVARYFAKEQAAIDQLAAELEGVTARLTELEEEHGGEEGAFSELDKVNRANVVARLKELEAEQRAAAKASSRRPAVTAVAMAAEPTTGFGETPERDALKAWLDLSDTESALKKRLKEAEADLDARALAQYPKVTEADVKTLVVDDKWLAIVAGKIHSEMDAITRALTQRLSDLVDRYERPLPAHVERVEALESSVDAHLRRMGFSWK